MSRVWLVACLSAGLLMTGPVRASEELAERARVSGEAIEAFLGGDYARLERVSSAYRADKTRTASGLWKLTFFYIGLANAVDALAGSDGTDAAYDDLIARTDAWSRQYPGSPGACITRSMVHVAHAWYFRGSGFADSVAPEAWEPFEKYIALARQELESHKATASIDPRWYESMLIVARAQGWPRKQFDALLDEALDREPTYYQTYFTALFASWSAPAASAHKRSRHFDSTSSSSLRRRWWPSGWAPRFDRFIWPSIAACTGCAKS